MNHTFLQVFYAIFSGLIQGLAISNEILHFGSPFLGLFCLIPLYIAVYRAKSYREAFRIFALQTLTVHLTSSYWLYNFHGFAIWSLGASALGTAVLGGLTGLVIFFFPRQLGYEAGKTELEEAGGRRPYLIPARILWFSSGFVFWEWIKSTGFLGYPWGTLFMAAYRWKIMTQIADITGVWGITFVFALFNAVVAEGLKVLSLLLHSQKPEVPSYTFRKTAKAVASILCLTALYGIFQYLAPRTPKKTLNAIIVQQNVDPWEGGDSASISISSRLTEREVNRMRDSGKEPDLVLWSEGALTYTFPSAIDYYSQEPDEESLTDFIGRMNVPFLIGGSAMTDRQHRKVSNSAILFDRKGDYAGFYSKIHMVPFAEEVPLMDNPLMAAFMANVVGMPYTLTPGNQYVIFKIPLNSSTYRNAPIRDGLEPYGTIELSSSGLADPDSAMKYRTNPDENPESYVRFSSPICFEDAFPDVCTPLFNGGSEVFLNITNDSWSKTPSSEYQHFIVASFLAIEYRTTLVRCANAGYSVVVGPNGKILNDMDVFTEDAMGVSIPIYERKATVFSIWGNWFAYTLFAFMALYFIVKCAVFNFKRIKESPVTVSLAKAILREDEEPEADYEPDDFEEEVTEKAPEIHAGFEWTDLMSDVKSPEKKQEEVRSPAKRTGTSKTKAKASEPAKGRTRKSGTSPKASTPKAKTVKAKTRKAEPAKAETVKKSRVTVKTVKKEAPKKSQAKERAEKTPKKRGRPRKTELKAETRTRTGKREAKK